MNGLIHYFGVYVCCEILKCRDAEMDISVRNFCSLSRVEKRVLCGDCMAFDHVCWWIFPMVSDQQNTCTLSVLFVFLSQRSVGRLVIV